MAVVYWEPNSNLSPLPFLFRPLLLAKLCQILLLKIWVDVSAEQVGWWEMDLLDEDWSKNNLDNTEPKVFQLTVKADFTGKESRLMNLWGRATIVVMRQPGTSSDPLVYEDMTLADLRIAIDFFISYGDGSVQDLDIRDISLRSKAMGFRINCEGD